MLPVLIRPETLDTNLASTWAWYGATQVLGMLGVSYREATEASAADAVVIDPSRRQLCFNCLLQGEGVELPAAELLRADHMAVFGATTTGQVELPVFGPVTSRASASSTAPFLVDAHTHAPVGSFVTIDETRSSRQLQFHCPVFETVGLYLSRFSWPGNTSFKQFVREIDDLWDESLKRRWGGRAVVDEYLDVVSALLFGGYEQLGLPVATAWQHPCREGQVKRHGLIITHDVDQLFPDPSYRHKLAQTGNIRFCMPQWRELEQKLGVRSAYYFYTPKPGERYWFEPNYSPADAPVAEEIRKLIAGGWEVSLHQMSHDDRGAVIGENEFFREAVGQPTTGTRSHYLKHTFETLAYKTEAGLRYDSTWYAEQTESGFLCGCSLPYRPLDCQTLRPVGLWEFPFVVEDGIVFGVYGEGTARDVPDAIADGVRALDQVLAHDGYACLNWHNYTFEQMSHTGPAESWPPAQVGLVEFMRERSPALWIPLPIELAEWCSRRETVTVESEAGKVIVENHGDQDCPDFVLCLRYHADGAHQPPSGAQPLGSQGPWVRFGLPVPVKAGERVEIAM